MAKGYDMDDVPVNGRQDKKRPSDLVEFVKLGEKYTQLRIVGETFMYGGHWVKTKKKDGTMAQFYTPCSAFDPETAKRDSTKDCPWCKHEEQAAKGESLSRFSVDAYTNVIVRKAQRSRPEELDDPTDEESESGFKVIRGIRELKELNVHEVDGDSQAFGLSHPKYGCDFLLKKDVKAPSPSQMYSVQKGDHKPVNKEERKYLTYDLSDLQEYPSEEEAKGEFKRWAEKMLKKSKSPSQEAGDEDESPAPKKKKPLSLDEDDEEEDTPPPKGKKKAAPVDDEDEDEDTPPPKKKRRPDPEEEEEDEPPPPRKKKAAPVDDEDEDEAPRKKKRPSKDDFDDEDL
jgi:hypothetical protein